MNYIIPFIIWLIISEIIYIIWCKTENKKRLEDDDWWIGVKIISLIISGMIIFIGYLTYLSYKEYSKETNYLIIGILILIVFFYINKKIGLRVAKKKWTD